MEIDQNIDEMTQAIIIVLVFLMSFGGIATFVIYRYNRNKKSKKKDLNKKRKSSFGESSDKVS